MNDAAEKEHGTQRAAKESEARPGNYRQNAVLDLNKPIPEKREGETKKERKERERLQAVATIKERAARDNAFVLEARERFAVEESEARMRGTVLRPYDHDTFLRVLEYVEQAIPLGDYSEFPGAPERPGACTLAGLPYRAFRRWQEERAELRASLARARMHAADTLADRHLHLARVALEVPWASDAVRVAGDILRWQASIRNRDAYGDERAKAPLAQGVTIYIGTEAKPQPRILDAELVTVLPQDQRQLPDATG